MENGNLSRQPRGGALVWTPSAQGVIRCWERPLVGCRYLVTARPGGALKATGGDTLRERSVILVLRQSYLEAESEKWQPHRLVCRLVPPVTIDPTPLAEQTVALARWYGNALIFAEVKDGPIFAKEVQRLGGAVQIREVLDKATSQYKQDIGWLTDEETGPAAVNALVNVIRETPKGGKHALQVECDHVLNELKTFAFDDCLAPSVEFDDDVRALATGIYNIEAASRLRQETRARQEPNDGWKVVDRFKFD